MPVREYRVKPGEYVQIGVGAGDTGIYNSPVAYRDYTTNSLVQLPRPSQDMDKMIRDAIEMQRLIYATTLMPPVVTEQPKRKEPEFPEIDLD